MNLSMRRREFLQREFGTKKLVNGKQLPIWFVPAGIKGLPQIFGWNFRKTDLADRLYSNKQGGGGG